MVVKLSNNVRKSAKSIAGVHKPLSQHLIITALVWRQALIFSSEAVRLKLQQRKLVLKLRELDIV